MNRPDTVSKPKEGRATNNIADVVADFLERSYAFRFNTVKASIEIKEPGGESAWQELNDRKENSIVIAAIREGIKDGATMISRLLRSEFVPPFDPIAAYFRGLQWDGTDHIAALARTVLVRATNGAREMVEQWPVFLRRWLIGVVACALDEGFQNQLCLILVGGQGIGKTTWLEKLVPRTLSPYAYTGHVVPSLGDKNTATFLAEKFIINVDDQFETIFGRDFNAMKGIITATSTTIRKPYERSHIKRPRIASFCGSVNNVNFLTDEENRRYLCFETKFIYHRHSVNIDQVFAQVYHLWKQGEKGYLSPEEREVQRKINTCFQSQSAEMDWLRKVFKPALVSDASADWLQVGEILAELQDRSRLKLNLKRLKIALAVTGFSRPVSRREERFSSPRYLIPLHRRTEEDEHELKTDLKHTQHEQKSKP